MTDEQLKEAISEYDIGNKLMARLILMDLVENEPANEEAWLLLSIYGETSEQRFHALQQAIAINPDNQSTRAAFNQYGFTSEAYEYERRELNTTPYIKTSPDQVKKEQPFLGQSLGGNWPERVNGPENEVQAGKNGIAGNNLYRVGISLFAGAILLWGVFIGLLIKNQVSPFIPVTGLNSTSTVDFPTATLETVQNASNNTPTPTYTLQLTVTNLPTSNQTPTKTVQPTKTLQATKTIQPTASKTPTRTVQPTSTLPPTQTNTPSSTPIPTFTLIPTNTPLPTIPLPGGILADPIQAGVGYRFIGDGVMTVKSSSWVPGQTGIVSLLISFNCERVASEICPTETYTFDLISGSGSANARLNSPTIPQPSFGSITNLPTYGGTTESGYVGFLIISQESLLVLRVGNTLEPGLAVYFSLP